MTEPATIHRSCVRHCKVAGQHTPRCTNRRTCSGCAPRPVVGDGLLCSECHRLFRRALSEIADMWPALRTGVKRKAGRDDSGRSGSGGHAEVGDFWNPQAATALLDIEDHVSYLIRLYTPADKRLPKLTDKREFVLQNLRVIPQYYARFLAGHETLGPALLADALALRIRAQQAIDGTFVRRYAIAGEDAVCSAEVAANDIFPDVPIICGGQLVAVIQPSGNGRKSKVMCSNDPRHTVDAENWIHYLEGAGFRG